MRDDLVVCMLAQILVVQRTGGMRLDSWWQLTGITLQHLSVVL